MPMNTPNTEFKTELKQLIIDECDKEYSVDAIADGIPLVGEQLDIDSLDVLQICMAIQQRYGVRIEGSNKARKLFRDIDTLANHVARHRQ